MDAKINLNDYVWVCVNEHGWKVLEEFYKNLFTLGPPEYNKEHIENAIKMHRDHTQKHYVNGEYKELTEMQLHEFMNIFGSKCYNGAQQFIENNIVYLTLTNA